MYILTYGSYNIQGILSCLLFNLQLFCIGVLTSAAICITAINKVEDFYANGRGGEYEKADSYRSAAVWLIAVTSTGILLHILILVRVLCFTSAEEKYFISYAIVVCILNCLLYS